MVVVRYFKNKGVVMSNIHKGLGLGSGLTGMTRQFKGVYEEKFEGGGWGLGVVLDV